MKVYLAQLLCPNRHCVVACANELASMDDAKIMGESLLQRFTDDVAAEIFNPWCGICKSRDLHVEVAETRFHTMEEAMPEIQKLAIANAVAAEYLKQSQN